MSLSTAIAQLKKLSAYRYARAIPDLFKDRKSRNAALLLLLHPRGLYQPFGTTSEDRYPAIFGFVRDRITDGPDVRILSFGCATGEEVFSLRRYFPLAIIHGIDISTRNIAICRRRLAASDDARIEFIVANSTALEPEASYDAIFAMAVFRHGDLNISSPPSQCDHCIRFTDFQESIADLARVVKPGGLLVIQHAMFRFSDTAVASEFDSLLSAGPNDNWPIYSTNNRLVPNPQDMGVVFQKSI
jgi:SAM-dependent methyltransferase